MTSTYDLRMSDDQRDEGETTPEEHHVPTLGELLKGNKSGTPTFLSKYNEAMADVANQIARSTKPTFPGQSKMEESISNREAWRQQQEATMQAAAASIDARRVEEREWRDGLLEQQTETVRAINNLAGRQDVADTANTWILRLTAVAVVIALLTLILGIVALVVA